MAKYLIHASYSTEGTQGLLKEGGSKRREEVEETLKGLGAKLEALYYAFGEDDAIAIIDAPDNISLAALSLVVSGRGAVKTKTTVLLTPEELDEATKKNVDYRAPGN